MSTGFIRVQMTKEKEETEVVEEAVEAEVKRVDVKPRKTLQGFMDRMKTNLIELFKEEEDTKF